MNDKWFNPHEVAEYDAEMSTKGFGRSKAFCTHNGFNDYCIKDKGMLEGCGDCKIKKGELKWKTN